MAGRAEYCGLFRTPTLRNVALRRSFFHNGVVHTCARRSRSMSSATPSREKWYPRNADGSVRKFDDLPRST